MKAGVFLCSFWESRRPWLRFSAAAPALFERLVQGLQKARAVRLGERGRTAEMPTRARAIALGADRGAEISHNPACRHGAANAGIGEWLTRGRQHAGPSVEAAWPQSTAEPGAACASRASSAWRSF